MLIVGSLQRSALLLRLAGGLGMLNSQDRSQWQWWQQRQDGNDEGATTLPIVVIVIFPLPASPPGLWSCCLRMMMRPPFPHNWRHCSPSPFSFSHCCLLDLALATKMQQKQRPGESPLFSIFLDWILWIGRQDGWDLQLLRHEKNRGTLCPLILEIC